jgi:hypothetical protein
MQQQKIKNQKIFSTVVKITLPTYKFIIETACPYRYSCGVVAFHDLGEEGSADLHRPVELASL